MATDHKERRSDDRIYSSATSAKYTELPSDQNTIPKAFLKSVDTFGNKVAMRKKRLGLWQEYTWKHSFDHVHNFCLGLVALGLKREDKVAIIGENDPEFYWAQLAVQAAGGVTTAIFTDANLQELAYVIKNSKASFLIAHDQEQCDKALDLKDQITHIKKVIFWEDRGLWNYDDDWLISFESVESLGRDYANENAGAFEKLIAEGGSEDIAIFSYTSGTTSLPKAAMIRHRNLLAGNLNIQTIVPRYADDDYVSFTPLAWITEQALGLVAHCLYGFQVNFPESPETVQTDIREIAPSSLLFPSRLWEGLARTMQNRINDSFWINRQLFRVFLPIAYRIIDLEDMGKPPPAYLRLLRLFGEWAVFQPLRDKIGMVNMRDAVTTGAALSPDVLRFFRALGVELKSLYGSTEMQTVTLHHPGKVKLASVGQITPGVEVKIAEDGEIRVRSLAIFAGYFNADDQTQEAFDSDGFFKTGDAGYIDNDGHLIYLDRVKDMIELANGERFSPQYIEGRLKFSQFIQDVMAIGGIDMPFVSCIIIIDFNNASRWAEKNRINFTTYVDLTQKPEIADLIKEDIERVNGTLPPAARIARFVILHKEFDADEAELTRTRKLRRSVLAERYGNILEAINTNKSQVDVRAEVKYRDGRTGVIETAVNVNDV